MHKTAQTIADKLLLACIELSGGAETEFTAEDLVVKAWERFPDTFGLQGYAERFPDSNRVLSNIMGRKGLAGARYIEKTGEKTYRLTTTGIAAASGLVDEAARTTIRAALDRKRMGTLVRLLESRAFTKFRGGQQHSITQRDVFMFFGITVRSDGRRVRARLDEIEDALRTARSTLDSASGAAIARQHGGASLDDAQLSALETCYDYVRESFADDLSQLMARQHKQHDGRKN